MKKSKNTQTKRDSRRRWKENDKEMHDLYNSNQTRINQLERMVDELSSELTRTTSHHALTQHSRKRNERMSDELSGQLARTTSHHPSTQISRKRHERMTDELSGQLTRTTSHHPSTQYSMPRR